VQVQFVTPKQALWTQATDHIGAIYDRNYGAKLTDFAPEIVVVTDDSGVVCAAAGLRFSQGGLFSSAYLDEPIERALGRRFRCDVAPDALIEIVTLAAERPVAVWPLFAAIIAEGRKRGKSVGLFTATTQLRSIFTRLGLPLTLIAPASADRVQDPECWGRYYQADPWVCAVPDPGVIPDVIVAHRARKMPRHAA